MTQAQRGNLHNRSSVNHALRCEVSSRDGVFQDAGSYSLGASAADFAYRDELQRVREAYAILREWCEHAHQ